jgi:S-adenosylmethionine:tRNA ribosyltransferase-isomerase
MVSPLAEYYYELPDELIANEPANPRDSARLLVCNSTSGEICESTFKNLADVIPRGALLVMNETKVVPARIIVSKETGGKVELLFFINEWNGGMTIHGLSDRKIVKGQTFFVGGVHVFTVVLQNEGTFEFKIEFSPSELISFFHKHGITPIPKYIGETKMDETMLRERYQTVFAKEPGSIAAPTASLHFTDRVFTSLASKSVDVAFVTLHVGLGTFAPVTEENVREGKLHTEPFSISTETILKIRQAKKEGRMVIPVGTTALRAVESASADILGGVENSLSRTTNIFIKKPYAFKIADGLITNFHVPESSLMCLVDAFLSYKRARWGILDVYAKAIEKKFRFYSFGDGMIIL